MYGTILKALAGLAITELAPVAVNYVREKVTGEKSDKTFVININVGKILGE